jgi:hypothetical protein
MGIGFEERGEDGGLVPTPPALLPSLVGFNFSMWFQLSSAGDISSGRFLKTSIEIIFLHAVP